MTETEMTETEMMERKGHRPPITFATPSSVEAAEARKAELTNAIAEIQAQLADRDRRDPSTGERMAPSEYWRWRKSAIAALTVKTHELRFLKRWLREQRALTPDRVVRADVRAFAEILDARMRHRASLGEDRPVPSTADLARRLQAQLDAFTDARALGGQDLGEAALDLAETVFWIVQRTGLLKEASVA